MIKSAYFSYRNGTNFTEAEGGFVNYLCSNVKLIALDIAYMAKHRNKTRTF